MHDTHGRWELLAELRAELRAATMIEPSQLQERVGLAEGIANTETSILLATYR